MVKQYAIETSLTTEYRKGAWGLERIVLDSVSNHLPNDSNGTKTSVLFKQDGVLRDFRQYDNSKPVEEIVFDDDGSGYDAAQLSVLFSTKDDNLLSVGQFGEGLKLVAAASLREGVDIQYFSKNWSASPFPKVEIIGNRDVKRICFNVTENGERINGSRTVFRNPSKALIREVLELPDKVLQLNDCYTELHNESDNVIDGDKKISYFSSSSSSSSPRYNSRIIDLNGDKRSIFVKGVRIHNINSLFSYDLGINDISPDRASADRNKSLDKVRDLLKNCANVSVVRKVLQEAKDNPYHNYYEFEAFADRINLDMNLTGDGLFYHSRRLKIDYDESKKIYKYQIKSKNANNLWSKTFRELFGENAVLASENAPFFNTDAEYMGFTPVRINSGLACYLKSLGIKTAEDIKME